MIHTLMHFSVLSVMPCSVHIFFFSEIMFVVSSCGGFSHSVLCVDLFLFLCRVEGGQAQRRALPLTVQLPPQPLKAPHSQ